MNVVLLSGGSGTRLWPLSNEVRSKQFIKILKKEDGSRENMVQRMYRMIKEVDKNANILIATSLMQVSQIKACIGNDVDLSIEPSRRDTFPAIVLACLYLYKNRISLDEPIVICPVDPYVEIDYFYTIKEMINNIDNANLTLMGIKPTYPSEKYGYIMPNGKFVEKPSKEKAEQMIKDGALWNAGVFAFKLKYIIDMAQKYIDKVDYDYVYKNFDKLKKISFDYAVLEKEKSIQVIKYNGEWKDIGTWNTLTEVMSDLVKGNVLIDKCSNTHVINELSIPLLVLGINDAVVAITPDGMLVSNKNETTKLKEYVHNDRPMSEHRSWGEYKVLDYQVLSSGLKSLTKELIIKEKQHISYQVHKFRTEVWTIIEGEGELILDGIKKNVLVGDVIKINANEEHSIKAIKELHIIEVQIGTELTEEDIVRIDYDFDK